MISVLVVTYNGETYIREQIDSILKNIGLGDELVVSDDGSLDTTREILKSYQEQDARIRVMEGPGEGVIANVEAGLRACRGDYIFLADQDDVWMPDKVEKVMEVFRKKKAMVVVHEFLAGFPDLAGGHGKQFGEGGQGAGVAPQGPGQGADADVVAAEYVMLSDDGFGFVDDRA